jgi:large subunit ribosomal protein L21
MFAVIETGGKQHRVKVGDVVRVESLEAQPGEAVVFDRVLLAGTGKDARVGRPTLDGARVRATVVEQGRSSKIVIYTFKHRKNANRKRAGHRQNYTAVRIDAIEA